MTEACVHSQTVNGPATHVFLIGISDYPHLKDGSGNTTQLNFSLGQLSSPTASVEALADWFIGEFECSDRPLASVWLQLSKPGNAPADYTNPRTGKTFSVPRGTLREVRSGLIEALIGLPGSPPAKIGKDDQFLFYFAGHGLSAGTNDFYLLRDFGADPLVPLAAMINYSELMTNMERELPSRQYFVFDACRDVKDRVEANKNGGDGLLTADPAKRLGMDPVQQCAILSTEKDGLAYGREGEPSVCASAYLRAIAGAAGKRSTGGWNITTGRMVEALNDFQTLGFGPNAGLQQASDPARYKDFPIMRLAGAPKVPVFLQRADGASLKGAKLHYRSGGSQSRTSEDIAERYWEGQVDIGEYEFEVEVDEVVWPTVSDFATPTHLPLEVQEP